jgi:5'(3')-deoxyribonucleotidase
MNKKTIILLDADGCIADFTKAVCKVHDIDYENLLKTWTPGVFDIASQLNIHEDVMWKKIDKHPTFWEDIEPYPYAEELVDYLQSKFEVHICTSPSRHSDCLSGKDKWLKKHINFKRNFVMTPNKELLAKENHCLIDDFGSNVEKFKNNGGKSILFPQPWNDNYELSRVNKVEYIMNKLENIS